MGFYISDHPLNQYKSIFNQYNITNYDIFENSTDIISSNVACTVLKTQEKKTQKGSSYGIIKFSDLSNVFELFIFSEIFETNRENLKEGNSVMITLMKNYIDENKTQKRINVKKIISLKNIMEKPIKNISFKFNKVDDLKKLKKLSLENGDTQIKVLLNWNDQTYLFRLKNKRYIDNKLINNLDLEQNVIFD